MHFHRFCHAAATSISFHEVYIVRSCQEQASCNGCNLIYFLSCRHKIYWTLEATRWTGQKKTIVVNDPASGSILLRRKCSSILKGCYLKGDFFMVPNTQYFSLLPLQTDMKKQNYKHKRISTVMFGFDQNAIRCVFPIQNILLRGGRTCKIYWFQLENISF